jgi:DNA excision repair protein ERCC-8
MQPGAGLQTRPLARVLRGQPCAHRFLASCVAWYPLDNGMFASGSYDCTVGVWDTNT